MSDPFDDPTKLDSILDACMAGHASLEIQVSEFAPADDVVVFQKDDGSYVLICPDKDIAEQMSDLMGESEWLRS